MCLLSLVLCHWQPVDRDQRLHLVGQLYCHRLLSLVVRIILVCKSHDLRPSGGSAVVVYLGHELDLSAAAVAYEFSTAS